MRVVCWGLSALVLSSMIFLGCSPKSGEAIVLEVGANKVNLYEYESFFSRNSGGYDAGQQSSLEERERFLTLLTNYKLKLQDAYDRDLIHDSDIVDELGTYRSSLAASFVLEREITEPGIRQMYDRRREEIRAQHILLAVKPDANPEDTLRLYNKALELIQRAKAGENFDSLALKNSEDRSVASNRGDVYYFSGGMMLREFEEAAYGMKKGEISSIPPRTSFGYHIIKILDRQQARGTIKVRHIMARFLGSADSTDTASAYQRIQGYQDSLKKGWDYEKLAAKISEDAPSAAKGGELGWFERRRLVQQFDEAAFKMNVGEVSGIVRTPYGYHIIRCDSMKPFLSYPEMRLELKKVYEQYRYSDDYASLMNTLKKKYNFSFNEDAFRSMTMQFDTLLTIGDSAWDETVSGDVRNMRMMSVNGRSIKIDSVLTIFKTREEYNNTLLKEDELRNRVNRLIEKFILDEYSVGLEQRSPEFGLLMKDYRDGVVLYKAEQMEVWNKVTVTDSLLRKFYAENPSKFMFPERVDISQIHLAADTLAASVYESLLNGANFNEIADRYNEDNPELKENHGSRGLLPVSNDDLTEHAAKLTAGEISEPVPLENGGYAIVRLNKKEPARVKTFEEAGAEISNVFQEFESKRFEQEWIDRVKKNYPVIEHKDVLKQAFTSPRDSH